MSEEPTQIEKRAIDVTPYEHGVWCTVAGNEPFVNEIVLRKWSDDGTQIIFMLDTHNFIFADPDENILVVEKSTDIYPPEFLTRILEEDREKMENRP